MITFNNTYRLIKITLAGRLKLLQHIGLRIDLEAMQWIYNQYPGDQHLYESLLQEAWVKFKNKK